MIEAQIDRRPRPKISPIAIVGTIAGVVLFVYTLQAAGPREILSGIRRIGIGFVLVLLLSGIRMAVRAKAWSLCVEDREHFSFRQAFAAFVTGDAIGNITPLGPLASESTKALLSRQKLPGSDAVSSVVLENIFYSISVAIVLMAGTLAFLLGFRPTDAVLTITIAVSVAALVGILLVWWLFSSQPRLLSRLLKHDGVRAAEDRIYRFAAARKDRVATILFLEFMFHAAAVLEIYALLMLLDIDSGRNLLLALVLEAVERVITIAFKFVPLRLGVDQAGSGSMTELLGIGWASGVTIATVRTTRNLFWAAVGLMFLLGKSAGQQKGPAESSRPSTTLD
jgi:lysylphosphatidylglycerol synthase-like protein